MFDCNRRNLRTILASSGVIVAALALLLLLVVASDGSAQSAQSCTVYVVTNSAPPPSGNWTDTSGLWTPAGSYPGQSSSCDTAADFNPSPTIITVNTAIPNPIGTLGLSCGGCIVDVQPGGSLTLLGGTIDSGASLHVNGGTVIISSGTNPAQMLIDSSRRSANKST